MCTFMSIRYQCNYHFRQRGLPFPHDNLEEFRPVVSLTSKQPSLVDFLKVFPAISQIMRFI